MHKGLRRTLENRNLSPVFEDRTSFGAKKLRTIQNRKFTSVFGDRTSFRAKGFRRSLKISILLELLKIEPHFVPKGFRRSLKISILLQFLKIEPHFVRKGCRRGSKLQLYNIFFCRSNLISCKKVAAEDVKSQFYSSF